MARGNRRRLARLTGKFADQLRHSQQGSLIIDRVQSTCLAHEDGALKVAQSG